MIQLAEVEEIELKRRSLMFDLSFCPFADEYFIVDH